ncbi:MAG TPA: FixG Ig-like domain-containing protein [Candidatus Nanoarchaeia archaeon]|nr:FixG Ig-like domain-containing protein [Candidatus Nanoarchaeia archaeon]
MNKVTKTIGMIAMLIFAVFGGIASSYATLDPFGVSVNEVKVNGDSLNADQAVRTQFERDSELDVTVKLQADNVTSAQDVEVSVFLTGSKDKVSDTSKPFDIVPNTIYTKTFTLDVPEKLTDREYQLRVVVSSPNSQTVSYVYPLLVDAVDHSIAIKEVTFSPNGNVVAGRAMTAVARLKNYGVTEEQDVKVVFSIPALGVQETDYINEIEEDEAVSTEEVLLRIPANARSGTYDVDVTAYYDDYDEKTKATYSITVVGDSYAASAVGGVVSTAPGKTVIAVGPQSQSVARGENGVVYPVSISNAENTARTFTLLVSGTNDWATVKVSPSNVVIVNPGETKQAYVYVAASEQASLGEHVFSLDVKSGNDIVQQIPLKADVLEGTAGSAWSGVKTALQVGITVLVLLILVLAVVIVYQRRMKGNANSNDESEQIAQTYY